jgi:hypothetical protein
VLLAVVVLLVLGLGGLFHGDLLHAGGQLRLVVLLLLDLLLLLADEVVEEAPVRHLHLLCLAGLLGLGVPLVLHDLDRSVVQLKSKDSRKLSESIDSRLVGFAL